MLDDVLKDWGDRANYGQVRGRKGRNIAGGRYERPAQEKQSSASHVRAVFAATVRKTPEVMVKISGGGKDLRSIKAHLDYISRNGEVELEDEQGRIHSGMEEVRAVRDDWRGAGIPAERGTRKEAFNIILSMPPGTDRASVRAAASEFAKQLFSGHQYVFAEHADEKHPHVHLVVRAVDVDGVRLNPRKAELQRWREVFADKLKDQGIEANATPRTIRGIVQKAERQSILHMDKEHRGGRRPEPSRVHEARSAAARAEREGRAHVPNPAADRIASARRAILRLVGDVARELSKGGEDAKRVSQQAVQFVKALPALETRHQRAVRGLGQGRELSAVQKATERPRKGPLK